MHEELDKASATWTQQLYTKSGTATDEVRPSKTVMQCGQL